MDCADRRCQVLVERGLRTQERWRTRLFISCVDGLKGFPKGIEAVCPKAAVQICIVNMVRNSLNYAGWNKRDLVAADLKSIYIAATADEAEKYRSEFGGKRDDTYPPIAQF